MLERYKNPYIYSVLVQLCLLTSAPFARAHEVMDSRVCAKEIRVSPGVPEITKTSSGVMWKGRLVQPNPRVIGLPRFFQILDVLTENPNSLVSNESLFRVVWPERALPETKVLNAMVFKTMRDVINTFLEHDAIFYSIQRQGTSGFVWEEGASSPDFVYERGDLEMIKYHVFWKGHLLPRFSRPENDLEARAILTFLFEHANAVVDIRDITRLLWPDATEPFERLAFRATKLIRALNVLLLKADKVRHRIRKVGHGGYLFQLDATASEAKADLRYDVASQTYTYNGQQFKLGETANSLLLAILEDSPRHLSRRRLMKIGWGTDAVHEKAQVPYNFLASQISIIRSAFKQVDRFFSAIAYDNEKGYAWIDSLPEDWRVERG